jgi:predicted DNA-binding protein (MmcQ/YjbR family)
VSPDALRDLCLSFVGSEETFPFGFETSVFKVAGKMFALSRMGADPPLRVSMKCDPGLAEGLREAHPGTVLPGYHLNKRHWNTVILDGSLPDQMVGDMVEDSYDLIVSKLPRARQRALGWAPERP